MSKPVAHYSPFTRAGDWLIISGQIGLSDGALVDGLEAQTRQVLANLQGVLDSAGAEMTDIAKCTIFLSDIGDFATVNEVYGSFFEEGAVPARACVQVAALPKGAKVEIDAIAHVG